MAQGHRHAQVHPGSARPGQVPTQRLQQRQQSRHVSRYVPYTPYKGPNSD